MSSTGSAETRIRRHYFRYMVSLDEEEARLGLDRGVGEVKIADLVKCVASEGLSLAVEINK
jgi:hypothetical protein